MDNPFAQLPIEKHDCWRQVDGETVPDLPATHTEQDFEAAIALVKTEKERPYSGKAARLYGYSWDAIPYLDPEGLLDVWQTKAEEGHYIRPDHLVAAVAERLDQRFEEIGDEVGWYIFEADIHYQLNLDEGLRNSRRRLEKFERTCPNCGAALNPDLTCSGCGRNG